MVAQEVGRFGALGVEASPPPPEGSTEDGSDQIHLHVGSQDDHGMDLNFVASSQAHTEGNVAGDFGPLSPSDSSDERIVHPSVRGEDPVPNRKTTSNSEKVHPPQVHPADHHRCRQGRLLKKVILGGKVVKIGELGKQNGFDWESPPSPVQRPTTPSPSDSERGPSNSLSDVAGRANSGKRKRNVNGSFAAVVDVVEKLGDSLVLVEEKRDLREAKRESRETEHMKFLQDHMTARAESDERQHQDIVGVFRTMAEVMMLMAQPR
ncbi:hypothetical protein R1sor_027422 [Riccia sorocarpa]|uniref:Uncharacterized protein n=1 Tax=Riccia sorocarpa TaxID=122646 RepID=A0ABD3GGA7_9MARC